MGQLERGLNRIYGVEQDRPDAPEVRPRVRPRVTRRRARGRSRSSRSRSARRSATASTTTPSPTVWAIVRWPLALALMMAAIALLFRWSPRRHQPAWSWLAFGASVSVLLWVVVTARPRACSSASSTSFGDTYGPLAGIVALLLWALLSSVAVLFGARGRGAARGGPGRCAPRRRTPRRSPQSEPGAPQPAGARSSMTRVE